MVNCCLVVFVLSSLLIKVCIEFFGFISCWSFFWIDLVILRSKKKCVFWFCVCMVICMFLKIGLSRFVCCLWYLCGLVWNFLLMVSLWIIILLLGSKFFWLGMMILILNVLCFLVGVDGGVGIWLEVFCWLFFCILSMFMVVLVIECLVMWGFMLLIGFFVLVFWVVLMVFVIICLFWVGLVSFLILINKRSWLLWMFFLYIWLIDLLVLFLIDF